MLTKHLVLRYILMRASTYPINLYYKIRTKGLILGYKSRILPKSKFERYNKIDRYSVFGGEMGYASYMGGNCSIIAKIGRFCSISENVHFITSSHPSSKFVSTHPIFFSLKKQVGVSFVDHQLFDENRVLEGECYSIIVGNDVWIGHGVTVIGPVRIGDGAIIASNSTVTKDVEPYSIVAGSPAKILKYRFSEDIIRILLDYKWWDKNEAWWKENASKLSDIKIFIDFIKKNK